MKVKIITAVFLLLCLSACEKNKVIFDNNPDAPDHLHNRATGASANELLASGTYKSLKIEIQYMSGYPPDGGAMNHLQSVLATYLNKPSGITIVTKEIAASSSATLTTAQVRTIEEQNRTVFTTGDQIGV